MLRSIYQRLLGVFTTKKRRKTPRRVPVRRLGVESLESRQLLSIATLTTNAISDGGFEAPVLQPQAYQMGSPGQPGASNTQWTFGNNVPYQVPVSTSPWKFTGTAGISSNGSGFTYGDPSAPQGSQVGFIKDGGAISQVVTLETGVYDISLMAAQRLNYQTRAQTIDIYLDNNFTQPIGVITPSAPVTTNNVNYTVSYAPYQSYTFPVTAGQHTITFQGVSQSPADSTAFIDSVILSPVQDSIADGGFEEPPLPVNSFLGDTPGSAWQFTGTAGIAKNGSKFVTNWTVAQNAPAGSQVAYLEYTGSMSQWVWLDAGTYEISFLAAQRQIYQKSYQTIDVSVDGTVYGQNIDPVNTLYGYYYTTTFAVTAGEHQILFQGMDPNKDDSTAFIDQVTLTANGIDDPSFERPSLALGTSKPNPTGTPWTYTGTTGVASNGSGITSGNPNAPAGSQVAYIQGTGYMTQTVNLVPGCGYNLSFYAAQCVNGQAGNQQIEVLLNGAPISAPITPFSSNYHYYYTWNFTVSTEYNTIEFEGLISGKHTALIDALSLVATNDQIIDGGFESPSVAANNYQANPGGSPWTFSATGAGISTNGSGLTSGNPGAPQGSQVGYITNGGSITYTMYLDVGMYNLSFLAAPRVNYPNETIQVLVDGLVYATVTPASIVSGSTTSYPYTSYQTLNIPITTAKTYTITFQGMTTSSQSTAFIDNVTLTTLDDAISDGSFETPVLAAYAYTPTPGGSAWNFQGSAGITTNDSGFTSGSANAPDGYQAAYIKNGGYMTQTVNLDANTTFSISFDAAPRNNYPSETIQVLVDGVVCATVTPAAASIVSGSTTTYLYTPYQTANFSYLAAGEHTITFQGIPDGTDCTAFIDDVMITTGGGISDGSFEDVPLAANAYAPDPSDPGAWSFQGSAGISANNSAFTAGNPNAPSGYQVAYIKNTGSMSQQVDLNAGTYYNISFLADQRLHYQTQYESIYVYIDSLSNPPVGISTPATTNYGLCETIDFTVPKSGLHTIYFVGVDPNPSGGDNTVFIDNVQLNSEDPTA